MASADEGLKSEQMKVALAEALAGASEDSSDQLEAMLARYGGLPSAKPNMRLAAAFGAEVANFTTRPVTKLLRKFSGIETIEDDPKTFLPVAAAHAWAAMIHAGRDVNNAWSELADIASDERIPVKLGVLDAVAALAVREGGGDVMVERANEWLEIEEREIRYGALSTAIEVLGDGRVLAGLGDHAALFDFLSRALLEMADAPRSASRSTLRRRVMTALPRTLAAVIAAFDAADEAQSWFRGECERADDEDVREILSATIVRLRQSGSSQRSSLTDGLRAALEASAKPLRHAARVRPGTARGKNSRKIR